MEQSVYADVLFLINFSMDFLSLYICARVLHKEIRTLPLALAASVGGVYSVASLFVHLPLMLDIIMAYIMCLVAFGIGYRFSFSSSLVSGFVFFVCEMLLGGIMTAVINLLGRTSLADDIGSLGEGMPLWIFVILAPISSLLTYIGGRIFGRSAGERTVGVKIENEGNALSVTALVDSGNLLSDPVSGRAVVVVGYEKIRRFLPEEMRSCVEKGADISSLSFSWAKRVRLIPVSTLGEKIVLVGFVPDKMTVNNKGNKANVSAVVAFDLHAKDFGGCDAIIPTSLVKG